MMKTNSKIAHLIAKSSNWCLLIVIVVEIVALAVIFIWAWLIFLFLIAKYLGTFINKIYYQSWVIIQHDNT